MLAEYYFKIKHIKESDNAKADTLNRKEKLQKNDKISKALFKEDSNKKIKYNHLQLLKMYKTPISLWT